MPLAQPPPLNGILLVEDHELTIVMLTELLTAAFPAHAIHVARGGSEALRQAEAVSPAAIILDIGLPDCSGIDLARRLAQSGSGAAIVMHSNHDSAVFQEESLEAGASAFVSKNRVADLVPVIGRYIACPK